MLALISSTSSSLVTKPVALSSGEDRSMSCTKTIFAAYLGKHSQMPRVLYPHSLEDLYSSWRFHIKWPSSHWIITEFLTPKVSTLLFPHSLAPLKRICWSADINKWVFGHSILYLTSENCRWCSQSSLQYLIETNNWKRWILLSLEILAFFHFSDNKVIKYSIGLDSYASFRLWLTISMLVWITPHSYPSYMVPTHILKICSL